MRRIILMVNDENSGPVLENLSKIPGIMSTTVEEVREPIVLDQAPENGVGAFFGSSIDYELFEGDTQHSPDPRVELSA